MTDFFSQHSDTEGAEIIYPLQQLQSKRKRKVILDEDEVINTQSQSTDQAKKKDVKPIFQLKKKVVSRRIPKKKNLFRAIGDQSIKVTNQRNEETEKASKKINKREQKEKQTNPIKNSKKTDENAKNNKKESNKVPSRYTYHEDQFFSFLKDQSLPSKLAKGAKKAFKQSASKYCLDDAGTKLMHKSQAGLREVPLTSTAKRSILQRNYHIVYLFRLP
jgi:hypothetical protein